MSQFKFIDNSLSLAEGEEIEVKDKRIVHQLVKVLRVKEGQEIELCDGKMTEAEAEVTKVEKNGIRAEIKKVYKNTKEPSRNARLFCSVLKKDNFEWVAQKATEVGVKEITPIITERTVKNNLRIDRLHKIALEAAEQSGRGTVPEIREPMDFEEVAKKVDENTRKVFFHDTDATESFKIADESDGSEEIDIFIGPEGGWSEREIELANSYNMEFKGLGDLTLRAETAAVVGSYLMINLK